MTVWRVCENCGYYGEHQVIYEPMLTIHKCPRCNHEHRFVDR